MRQPSATAPPSTRRWAASAPAFALGAFGRAPRKDGDRSTVDQANVARAPQIVAPAWSKARRKGWPDGDRSAIPHPVPHDPSRAGDGRARTFAATSPPAAVGARAASVRGW